MLCIHDLSKSFILHNQGGTQISVLDRVTLSVRRHECLALSGTSGIGKSTLLRLIYANYLADSGSIRVRDDQDWVELIGATTTVILDLRERIIGHVSQFLRCIPRVSTLDLVMEPLLAADRNVERARDRARVMLTRLNLPERLWALPPATFSGGEKQRVNIAITLVRDYPLLLLDEPTAALDSDNREAVISIIDEAREMGSAIIGVFHDDRVRNALATSEYSLPDIRLFPEGSR